MSVTQILQNALSGDPSLQQAAEEQLRAASESNFSMYMVTMTDELRQEDRPPHTRRLAGILLKNSIDSKDRRTKAQFTDRWMSMVDEQANEQIKKGLLETLSSQVREANSTAAMVIAKLASIELPMNRWAPLIETLLHNVTSKDSPPPLVESTLDALGYMCEEAVEDELDISVLGSRSSQILSAVVTGMQYQSGGPESSVVIRRSAVAALLNALEFVRANFAVENERTYIMQNVCALASDGDVVVRKSAFECLVKIAELYYDYLDMYMNVIYQLTIHAIKQDEEVVALQAIEFWSTIAEEELGLEVETARDGENSKLRRFVHIALDHLCPVIFDCLMQQEELQDDDTWNKSTAAGSCLDLLSECAPAKIIERVVPFVERNIVDQSNWRAREAAIMAFGSILEGPSPMVLNPLIEKALPVMLTILQRDESLAVRDTAAWTVGRVCHVSKTQVTRYLKDLVGSLLHALKDEPQVAKNVCWAIHNLGELYEDDIDSQEGTLSPYLEQLIVAVLEATLRPDADENGLRPAAYETLSVLIQYMPEGNINIVERCVPLLIERLESTVNNPGLTADDHAANAESQGLLSGALSIATQRLKAPGIVQHADRMMTCYLQILNQGGGKSASVSEEVIMAIGTLADVLEGEFLKYVEAVMPILFAGLQAWDQYQVCSVAVGVIGDVCRAIEKLFTPFAEQTIGLVLAALGNNDLDKSVKPLMLSCLGDIALAIGGEFQTHFDPVMVMLQTAAERSIASQASPDDHDMVDWLLQLRSSVFEAFTGTFQGLRNDNRQEIILPQNEWMIRYCQAVAADEMLLSAKRLTGEKLLSQAAGVLGDMATTTPGIAAELRKMDWIHNLLERVCESEDASIRRTGMWATAAIERQ